MRCFTPKEITAANFETTSLFLVLHSQIHHKKFQFHHKNYWFLVLVITTSQGKDEMMLTITQDNK